MSLTNELFFNTIREVILISRQKVYRSVNFVLLETYWNIGKLIVEEEQQGEVRAIYGSNLLKNLSKELTLEFGKGFDYTNLTNMRKFYLSFSNIDALRQELSWTHYRILSKVDSVDKRNFYLKEAAENAWNSRELERQIKSLSFERTLNPISKEQNISIHSVLKDPYIFEFLGLSNDAKNTEFQIETAIIDHIQKFLLEFGKGFAFVARQQHIITDTSDFYIDLVFYNYILKCFVIIDLKTDKLSHQDIGQIDMYVRMYDDLKRNEGDNPTIGILLCTEKDETIVKYSVLSDNNKLFASQYMLYMPKEEDLKQIIDQDRIRYELNKEK
ncbi:PDDEXK nuclease domain-containing protein [Flavobacterium sp. HXWNR69]|uniref:PDDEXK nuclease domain-containing protein n=1 Tax=Flavobacterium fragile TaxID=2949085 RepID=A0ABT0TIA1_9FLAO|nr:PDDEXK nuclease domain-containing protein [Flavobacterium sp. HXWNR69]MCL9770694.1 PDDEXK nuclease domain-containing protein [Flavobacterium sp. HXWNR69]